MVGEVLSNDKCHSGGGNWVSCTRNVKGDITAQTVKCNFLTTQSHKTDKCYEGNKEQLRMKHYKHWTCHWCKGAGQWWNPCDTDTGSDSSVNHPSQRNGYNTHFEGDYKETDSGSAASPMGRWNPCDTNRKSSLQSDHRVTWVDMQLML